MRDEVGRSVGYFDLPSEILRAYWSILARFGVDGFVSSQNINHE